MFSLRKLKRIASATPPLLALFVLGWIAFKYPHIVLQLAQITAICSAALLVFFFIPYGKTTLGDSGAPISRTKWLFKLLLAQLGLFVLFIAAMVAFFGAGPTFATNYITVHTAVETVQSYTMTQWAIFPWAIYGCWGLILSYLVTHKQRSPHLYQITKDYCPKALGPFVKQLYLLSTNGSILMAVSFTLASVALIFAYFLEAIFSIHHFAVPLVSVFALYIAILCFALLGKRFYRRLVRNEWRLGSVMLLLLLAFVGVLFMAAWSNYFMLMHQPELVREMSCKSCQDFVSDVPVEKRFAAFFYGWWIMWAPLAGSYLAKISQGRTVREFVIGLLFVPALLLWGFTQNHEIVEQSLVLFRWIPTDIILLIVGLLALTALFLMFRTVSQPDWFLSGPYLPDADAPKSRYGLGEAPKSTGLRQTYQRIGTTTIMILLLHTLTGWYGIQFQLTAMAFVAAEVVVLSVLLFAFQLWQDRRLSQTQPALPSEPTEKPDINLHSE